MFHYNIQLLFNFSMRFSIVMIHCDHLALARSIEFHFDIPSTQVTFEQWLARGGGFRDWDSSPQNRNKCRRKMMLFPNALYLATFPKIDKNSTFPLSFHQKFSKFSHNFFNHAVCKLFWRIGKNNAILEISLRKISESFENAPASGGLRPPPPYEAGHTLGINRKFFPAFATDLECHLGKLN